MFAGQIAVSILSPPFCSLLCTHELRAPRDETYSTLLCQQHIGIVQSCTSFFTEAISDSLTKMFPCLEKKKQIEEGLLLPTEYRDDRSVYDRRGMLAVQHISPSFEASYYQSRPSAADRSELLIPLEHSDHRSAKENALLRSQRWPYRASCLGQLILKERI